jgi:hypothetical protein
VFGDEDSDGPVREGRRWLKGVRRVGGRIMREFIG